MSRAKVLAALHLGEGRSVEFKVATARAEMIGREVCAFINSGGGLIVVGVGDDGTPIGVPDPAALKARLEAAFTAKLSPRALVAIDTEVVEGKQVIVIEVPAGKDVPYGYDNVIYLRFATEIRKATVEEIRDMVLRRSTEPERWERRLSVCSTESDVDEEEVARAKGAIRNSRSTLLRDEDDPDAVLNRLEMAKYGRLTHGGVVVFGRQPGSTFPQARARAVAFAEERTSDTFRDQKVIEGPLVQVVDGLFDFIVRNTPTVSKFSPGSLRRDDSCIYPTSALREALVNAVVHRDYTEHSGGIAVHVYRERIEIWNSGALPRELTPESLLVSGHVSILRNPDIAHVVHLRGLMEKVGRGSVMIAEQCKEHGLPPPQWASDPLRGVTLTLRAPQVTPQVTPQVASDLAPEERLVSVLNGEMRAREIQDALGVRDREDFRQRYLTPALERALIQMTMPDKPTSSQQRYRLSPSGQRMKRMQSKKRSS